MNTNNPTHISTCHEATVGRIRHLVEKDFDTAVAGGKEIEDLSHEIHWDNHLTDMAISDTLVVTCFVGSDNHGFEIWKRFYGERSKMYGVSKASGEPPMDMKRLGRLRNHRVYSEVKKEAALDKRDARFTKKNGKRNR